MPAPLHQDPFKQDMMKWWLTQAMPDSWGQNRTSERRFIYKKMLAAEQGSPQDAQFVMMQLAQSTGRRPFNLDPQWEYGQWSAPAVCIRGYYPDRSERWDLCWTGTQWEFEVKITRRRRNDWW